VDRVAPETWYAVGFFFSLIFGPFIIGLCLMKLYRLYRPKDIPESEESSVSVVSQISAQRDGFFKIYLLGLAVCSPGFYYVYMHFLVHI
jgi:hypothetical protein